MESKNDASASDQAPIEKKESDSNDKGEESGSKQQTSSQNDASQLANEEKTNALGATVDDGEPGSDRVTKDEPKKPLVPGFGTDMASLDARKPQSRVETSANEPTTQQTPSELQASAPTAVSTGSNAVPAVASVAEVAAAIAASVQNRPTTIDTAGLNPIVVVDETETAMSRARAPLTSLYAPYIVDSDTCLEDARERLLTAIRQTHGLRQAFTERVYSKYRVCLVPPATYEETISSIKADPVAAAKRIAEERAAIKEEKEQEKRDATKLNAEISAAQNTATPLNVDSADQLMYFTAGLNLVILPEDENVDRSKLKGYSDRAPVNDIGQKVKAISQAAATAGEVMLDRARKAAAMRVERQRRKQLQLLSGEVESQSYSRLQVLSSGAASLAANRPDAIVTDMASLDALSRAKGDVGAASKTGRIRPPGSLASGTLLSIAPTADEINQDRSRKVSAATAALISRSSGILKTTQQRLKHPHPESHGGRRRASMNPMAAKKEVAPAVSTEPFLHAYLAMTLPPLPATRERLDRKPLPVCTPDEATIPRAEKALKTVLGQFATDDGKFDRTMSKMELLYSFRKESNDFREVKPPSATDTTSTSTANSESRPGVASNEGPDPDSPLDPVIAFCVLQSVGLVGPTGSMKPLPPGSELLPRIDEDSPMWSSKLKTLHKAISGTKRSLAEGLCGTVEESRDAKGNGAEKVGDIAAAATTESEGERIRGSGEALVEKTESPKSQTRSTRAASRSRAKSSSKSDDALVPEDGKPAAETPRESSNPTSTKDVSKRKYSDPGRVVQDQSKKRKYSDPGISAATAFPAQFAGGYTGQAPNASAMLAGHLAGFQPPPGDLSGFIGSIQQQRAGFDLASLLQGGQTLGMLHPGTSMPGYPVDGSANATRAIYSRDGTIIGPATFTQATTAYGPTAAMNAMLGPQYTMPFTAQPTSTSVAEAKGGKETERKPMADSNALAKDLPKPPPKEVAAQSSSVRSETQKKDTTAIAPKLTASVSDGTGVKPFEPDRPSTISDDEAILIKEGKVDTVISKLPTFGSKVTALDFLLSLGSAVPIPKALVANPLKERLNTPGFKNAGTGGAPSVPRDLIVATILVWLWAKHEDCFQSAFDKSGRFDVEPACKWLIQAAVDVAVRALTLDIAESMARGEGPFAEAASALRKKVDAQNTEGQDATKKLEIHCVVTVNKALAAEIGLNHKLNEAVPHFQSLVEYLDEARLCALRAKSQERTMLANLLSRKTTVSESFSQAYTCSMVRAGEALGHDELFETVQDTEKHITSMIAFDTLEVDDETWEDPCKPEDGFTPGLNGEDLIRRAHGRAMFQKALRKIQERNSIIRGGTPISGPYVDPGSAESPTAAATIEHSGPGRKRKASAEIVVPAGTGSARARNWNVYDPSHFSAPLAWDATLTQNKPYGLHRVGEKVRSLSLSLSARSGEPRAIKKAKRSMSLLSPPLPPPETSDTNSNLPKSTREIEWVDVAGIFQSVELPKRSPTSRQQQKSDEEKEASAVVEKTIFAPYCRKIEDGAIFKEDESDGEEDLSEEAVLARHQEVLDAMKAKLAAVMEARKRQQERRKSKSDGTGKAKAKGK